MWPQLQTAQYTGVARGSLPHQTIATIRPLHISKIQLIDVYGEQVPPYAILSHTWGADEVTLQDLRELSRQHSH